MCCWCSRRRPCWRTIGGAPCTALLTRRRCPRMRGILRRMLRLIVTAVAIAACSSSPPKTSTVTSEDGPRTFEDLTHLVTTHVYRLDPSDAVSLGLHEH